MANLIILETVVLIMILICMIHGIMKRRMEREIARRVGIVKKECTIHKNEEYKQLERDRKTKMLKSQQILLERTSIREGYKDYIKKQKEKKILETNVFDREEIKRGIQANTAD